MTRLLLSLASGLMLFAAQYCSAENGVAQPDNTQQLIVAAVAQTQENVKNYFNNFSSV